LLPAAAERPPPLPSFQVTNRSESPSGSSSITDAS
jgi:hypothetical protein